MKVVQINATCSKGSTGRICEGISRMLTKSGVDNEILCCNSDSGYEKAVCYAQGSELRAQALLSRLNGRYGFVSRGMTGRIIAELERFRPDVVHLHNLHSHNCDLELLFDYIKAHHLRVFWTFHDCWAMTGYCPHYEMTGCSKWQTGCGGCPQYRRFSWLFDKSHELYEKKKALFTGLDMTVITPSQWLADQVARSFFGDYPLRVIHNGVDLSVFKPSPSDFRKRHGIPDQTHILLGVAYDWSNRKGLDVFLRLAERLKSPDYQIVLVGVDVKTAKTLPGSILCIGRTESREELAQIYTAAALFLNPTREEVFGLVNIEANACGTPVVTFDTGGSPECICPASGAVVAANDIDAMEREVRRIAETRPYSQEDCIANARRFECGKQYAAYADLYTG